MEDRMNYQKILIDESYRLIAEFPSCDLSPGVNGPWRHDLLETRAISHAISLCAYSYGLVKDESIYQYLLKLSSKLEGYKENGAYLSRVNNGNFFNGLVGQAWVLEAYLNMYSSTEDFSILNRIEDLILAHEYDANNMGWVQYSDESGRLFGALNQQIFFASMVAWFLSFKSNDTLENRLRDFLSTLNLHLKDKILGVPAHVIKHNVVRKYSVSNVKLSLGYYSFILYGLAVMYKNGPKWCRDYIELPSLPGFVVGKLIRTSPFSLYYNQTDIEFALYKKYCLLEEDVGLVESFLGYHASPIPDECDVVTHRMRLYELIYWDN